jgi:outer membrane lipoprotein-sorting protein
MQYARIVTKSFIFVSAAAISTFAQTAPDQPDALGLLKNVELTYGAMNTYSAKVTNTMAMDGSGAQGKMNMETSVTVTADSTGKFRMESKGMMGMTLVYDGNTMWLYMPAANSYSKLPLNGGLPSAEAGAMGGGMFGGTNALQEYRNVSKGVKGAKIVRSEKLHVNDAEVECWVVAVEYEGLGSEASAAMQSSGLPVSDFARSKTLWVDKNLYLVYKDDSTMKMTMPNANAPTNLKQTSKVESVTVNDAVSPDVFKFTPPPGAKEMDESKFMQKTAEAPQSKN